MDKGGVSPYNILNVAPDCNIEQLKKQFKKMAVKYHPDKGGDKNIFNLMVYSFKAIHKDLKAKEDQKDFNELKNNYRQEAPNVDTDRFQKATDGHNEKFNKFFDANRTRDENFEKGYDSFINEPEVKTSEKHYKIKKYKEPEGSVLSKLQFEELGKTVNDFSGRNDDMHKLQFMDYQYAHTTSKLIEPEMVSARQEFKSIDDIQTKRKNENFELTDKEKRYYEKLNNLNNKREQKRISNFQKYEAYLNEHNKSVGTFMLE
jgi:curved DNA-binding protein CbpA